MKRWNKLFEIIQCDCLVCVCVCVLDCARRARTNDAFNLQQRGLEQPWLASPGEKTRQDKAKQSKARRVDLSHSFPSHCIEHDERRRRPCKEHRCSTSDQSSPARSFFLHNPTHSLPLPPIPSACLLPGLCLALTLHSPRRRRCLHSWMLNSPYSLPPPRLHLSHLRDTHAASRSVL